MARIKTILIVCTGNSCRSVMAAGLLKRLLGAGDNYQIITAGTAGLSGLEPTRETVQVMSEQGIDVSGHRSQALTDEMLYKADLILVMSQRQREHILKRSPHTAHKVHLLAEYGLGEEQKQLVHPDIDDPIGRSLDFYRKIFKIIKENIIRSAEKIKEPE